MIRFLFLLLLLCRLSVVPGSLLLAQTATEHAPSLSLFLEGTTAPAVVKDSLALVKVTFWGFDGKEQIGYLVVNRLLAPEITEIFEEIRQLRFPVESVIPIRFDKPDNGTTMDTLNNSYAFHYRTIRDGATLSAHALGRAIDLNPKQNPALYPQGRVLPPDGRYDVGKPGTLTAAHPVVKAFTDRGWIWGGNWKVPIDYMHFQKR
ncbi:MAG: M15 family metallopeptidase [Bacteroidales bacterium]